jgi:hypothetical protein
VSRDILRGAAEQFQLWVKEQADKWNAPIVEPPSPDFSYRVGFRAAMTCATAEPVKRMVVVG